MDKRTLYGLGILVAAAFGYYMFRNRQDAKAQEQPQDQGPAEAAQQYYASPPMFSAQPFPNPGTWVNQKQAMPLPYNT